MQLLKICLLFLLLSPAKAEDIEIYTGSANSVRSNVVMILDTSGSMSYWAIPPGTVTSDPYEPNTVYPTDTYGFESDAIYVFRPTSNFELNSSRAELVKEYKVSRDAVACDSALSAIDTAGSYNGKLQFWEYGDGWSAPYYPLENYDPYYRPSVNTNNNAILECEQYNSYDYNGSSYRYIRNNRYTPYTNRWWQRKSWSYDYYTVLWSGNYLNYLATVDDDESSGKTRLDLVREAAIDVMKSVSGVNISLMRFSSNSAGGFVDIPATNVEDITDAFETKINSYDPTGGTPLEESLYEAYLYLSGQDVLYGNSSQSTDITRIYDRDDSGFIRSYDGSTVSTPSSADSRKADNYNQYQAPEALECTPTKVILFSDGEPTYDSGVNDRIQSLLQNQALNGENYLSHYCSGNGACAEELAYYLARNDHRPDVGGIQNITFDTIGGFLGDNNSAQQKLRNIAEAGQGTFYAVDDYSSIRESLTQAVTSTITKPSTFTSPAVAVNSFNSLENTDQLYYAIFEPSNRPNWKGNLKRYRITSNGIVDVNDDLAIDENTGFFADSAQSYWSPETDGANVGLGGAASQLTNPRNIYTSNGSASIIDLSDISINSDSGTVVDQIPDSVKSILTDELLGIDQLTNVNEDFRDQLIGWILGYNEDATTRKEIEDPLHSRPVILNYGQGDSTAFISTNSGYLHAFDTDENNPHEYFAFIPRELLKNPRFYFDASVSSLEAKRYGLDGAITYWHDDKNFNGIVDSNEKVILYVGMRRGGHSYYALDVSDRNNPDLLWQINGAYLNSDTTNAPATSSGFERLGQTWSALTPAMINWNGERRVVLFAGGGYDPDEDGSDANGTEVSGPSSRIAHDMGNTIYMIDALTGELIWNAYSDATLTGSMTSSFAANISLVDRNNNGFVDMLYAADVGGRLWRFDFNEGVNQTASFATGGVIADINDSNDNSGNRRFYNSPDVSYIELNNEAFLLVSIGSGYRAHPLSSQVTDYHFLIKDNAGLITPEAYETISLSDLTAWGSEDPAPNGWYFAFSNSGEKVLASSITAANTIFFTTFTPSDPDIRVYCGGDTGQGRLYELQLKNPSQAVAEPEEMPGFPTSPVLPFVPLEPSDEEENSPTDPDDETADDASCEDTVSQTLVGTFATTNSLTRCNLIQQNFWRED